MRAAAVTATVPTGLLGTLRRIAALCLAAFVLQGCATLEPSDQPTSKALAADSGSGLGEVAARSLQGDDRPGFRPLPFSQYAMDARLSLIAGASRSVDVQYYLLQDDATGRTLLRALRDASARNVRVRILVDDLYTANSQQLLAEAASFPNIEIRLFNPFAAGRSSNATRWAASLSDLSRVNHRMHNKLLIVDGAFAVAGGRNMADEYFFHSRDGNFIDFDLLVAGRTVTELEALFDEYWNSPRVYPLTQFSPREDDPASARARFDSDTATQTPAFPALSPDGRDAGGSAPVSAELHTGFVHLLRGSIEAFADDPEKVSGRSEAGVDETTVTSHVLEAAEQAQRSLLLASPYFVPSAKAITMLQRLRARGVQVTLITNSYASTDEPFASFAYARYRKRLLELGVEIYEISPEGLTRSKDVGPLLGRSVGRSHAKIVVIDGATTFVGSMNMDLRSSRENTELGMFVHSTELADIVTRLLDDVRASDTYRLQLGQPGGHVQWVSSDGRTDVILEDEPGLDWLSRLKAILSAPFVADGLL